MARLLDAVEQSAASNRAVSASVNRLADAVSTHTKAIEKTQENFVKEYGHFRRETRELVNITWRFFTDKQYHFLYEALSVSTLSVECTLCIRTFCITVNASKNRFPMLFVNRKRLFEMDA